ncbi:CaiB/BaiF CoA transferase family protein [Granulicoccus phenolivorans]|uniref:CaiB/BaiF CoA transferase family protein n=1 Tax=Granulicoccus phenolivorans TaxID=266854 RepID=UPI000410F922|nr:CaiB/BaiF CoA-transferase family protein [Granulicoccus phenolivorans]
MNPGPLAGLRVVELAGIGPGPHAAMVLADLGADVVRIDRPVPPGAEAGPVDWLLRGRRSVAADLKSPADRDLVLDLIERADVLIEGFRPGVAERLGVGPEDCRVRNPRLIYGRITGWGQEGPRAHTAGHDLNYLSLTGGLYAIGRRGERPVPPLNLVADIGGGSLMLLIGVLAALLERGRTGRGQVIDAAMVDGTATVLQLVLGWRGMGLWGDERGTNLLDGGAPFYDTYACAGGGYVAVAALEPQFYAELLAGLGLAPGDLPERDDPANWPDLRAVFTAAFAARSREEWTAVFAGTDACVTPVRSFAEAAEDPHLAARGSLVEWGGVSQAAAAPRFSEHPEPAVPTPPPAPGADTAAVLADWLSHPPTDR